MLQFQNGSSYNALTLSGLNKANDLTAGSLHDLEEKDISELYIQACNGGHIDALITDQGYPQRKPLGQLMYQNGKPIDNQYYQERLLQIDQQMENVLSDIWRIGEDTLQGCIS